MTDDPRLTTARFRYEVIAPLIVRSLEPKERAYILRDLAARLWPTPDGRLIRIHARTIARWVASYRSRGYAGLLPEPRTDRGQHRRIADEVLQQAVALRREDPARSVRAIIRILELQGLVAPGELKRSTLSSALVRAGASRAELHPPAESLHPREAPYPNALWQLDTQHLLKLPDPSGKKRTIYLIACLDDYSRHVVAHLYPADDRPAMADLLRRAILLRGKPEILYCDNGANYRSELLKDACAELGIELRHSRPFQPAGRGKVERFFRTVDLGFTREAEALIAHGRIRTLEELQAFFQAWLESEYNQRIHSATRETPEARRHHVHPDHPVVTVPPERLLHAFLTREQRVVSAVGTISLSGRLFEVAPELARRKVDLRFDPFDLSHIEVSWQGQDFGLAKPLEPRPMGTREKDAAKAPEPERTPFHTLLIAHDEEQRQARAGRMRFARREGTGDV